MGEYCYTNNNKFEGDWLSGQCSNYGILTYHNGNIHEGNFKDNYKDGAGTFYDKANNSKFEGKWVMGRQEGYGVYYNCETKRISYKGYLVNGIKHGDGIEFYDTGHYYEGSFVKNLRHGRGKLYDNTGFPKYEGQWKNGKRNGFGTEKIKGYRGYVFVGTFSEGVKEGKGEEVFSNGDVYIGWYKNGKKKW